MTKSVSVKGLSKHFEIGALEKETTLQEKLLNVVRHPFRNAKSSSETLWALRNVTLDIERGEVVGIIGRNGAGKSTLLKILSKITYPTGGTVTVNGRVGSLLEVGTGFHEELTGRENIYLNGSILGMKKKEIEARLDAIVAFSGVERFIDTPIKRFSSGMRLRLGFAVAAHLDTDVLIIDEVLAVGDAGFQKKCLRAMEDLRHGGRTVLFVSHNMAAIENLCSRTIWIDDGTVRRDGETREVVEEYMATFAGNGASGASFESDKPRHGTGKVRYTGIEILSLDREPKTLVRSGDGLILRFHYRANEPVSSPSFGFRWYTELGTLVTDTSTWHHAMEIPLLPKGEGFIELELSSVNLLPGRYYLSLWLTATGSGVVHDCLEHCTRIDVEAANVYNSGRIIDGRFGIVYFPQRWHLGRLGEDYAAPSLEEVGI